MKRRVFAIFLSLLMAVSVFPFGAFATESESGSLNNVSTNAENGAQSATTEKSEEVLWEYEIYGDGVTLTKYLGSQTDVYVPSKIGNYNVVKLADGIFENDDTINSITLGRGILEIGARAFYDCDNLVCILLSEELTAIGANAFDGCDVFNSVILYNRISSIGENAFANCPKLTIWCDEGTGGFIYAVNNNLPYEILNPSATPETLEYDGINYYILNGEAIAISVTDTSITEVVIPQNVNGYPVVELRETFENCISLESVTMPHGLKQIGSNAFSHCQSLTSVEIPERVKVIGSFAFSYCKKLKSVVLPNSVEEVKSYAFSSCVALENVTLSENMTTIAFSSFSGCSGLTKIVIPYGVESIGSSAFSSCSKLTEVIIPSSVTFIGSYAFNFCTSLEMIYIPKNVIFIYGVDSLPANAIVLVDENSYAHRFAENNNLLYGIYDEGNMPEILVVDDIRYFIQNSEAIAVGTANEKITDVVIPQNVNGYPVTELRETFKNCIYLKNVSLPEGLKVIGKSAFGVCLELREITIPNSVESIGDRAFSSSRLSSIVLPNSVKLLGKNVFEGCSSLKSVTLSNSLKSISQGVFAHCYGLAEIVLPSGLECIEKEAFMYCSSLASVEIPTSVTTIGKSAFANCTSLEMVVLPSSVTSIYDASSFSGSTILVVEENAYAHEYASSNGFLYCVYDGENVPRLYEQDNIKYFLFADEAVAISVIDKTVKTAVVPEKVNGFTVTELRGTFQDCYYLESVELPSSLKIIGDYTFSQCDELESIILPQGIEKIGEFVFNYCEKLNSVVIPDGVETIGSFAFNECKSLLYVNLPDSVTYLGTSAFSGCRSLIGVTLPNGLEVIKYFTFSSCESLTSIVIPESVVRIEEGAFLNCAGIKQVRISKYVELMENDIFEPNTILIVEENSYVHKFAAKNNLLYFVVQKVENPEIAYGTSVEGVVTNSDGSVAGGTTVEIYYEDGTLKEAVKVDANGKYVFTYAEVGSYVIKAYNSNGNTASTRVSVKRMNVFNVFLSGDTSITLKAGYCVSGTVNASNATVKLTDASGNVIDTVETSNGIFAFDNVVNGTYLLAAETENGATNKEITVYNGNVVGVSLTINTNVADIYGCVEVADRKGKTKKRGWVTVSVYDELGAVVATTKSDSEGGYSISNLPLGDYFVVATISEMRPDNKLGYDRLYDLYGYGYISLTQKGDYELDTITLYEKNDYKTTVSGKANINKDKSKSCEFIMYNAFGVEFARINSENGKYSFKNVEDGLYVIIAVTENEGMGYAVITVLNGKVKGNTNINITKAEKIAKQEEKFASEVPEATTKENAEEYRERIAEEKLFYDGLSEKQKKQLSKKYVQKLNEYIELLTDCQYNSGVENGGLVVSADEILNSDEISFTITVEKQEMWVDNANGVETEQDFINLNMKDKVGDGEIVEYYEITMTKTSNGNDVEITSVYKDTDAMGKFRVTLEIPEEYRGQKHYSLVHVHCGEVTVLTDLDDNPDTITVEIDKFSTFALAITNEELVDESESTVTIDDIITFKGYSVGPNGTSICTGFDIDYEALELYEAKTGEDVDFGVVFTSYDRLNGENPLVSETGEANKLENSAVIKTSLVGYQYVSYELILTDVTAEIADHAFTIAAYLYNGNKTVYAQGEGLAEVVTGISLNAIKELVK